MDEVPIRANLHGMTRAARALAATTTLALAGVVWLYLDNRALRAELADRPAPAAEEAPEPAAKDEAPKDVWLDAKPKVAAADASRGATARPELPEEKKETRMDRRARRTEEFGAMFGRLDGETDDEYRARVGPLIKLGLARSRERAAEMRKIAEEKAGVTPEQSARLDQAFEKAYGDVLDYTNKAITDGQLSPYERNVAGWLEFAGGLGGMLGDVQGQIGKILEPGQLKSMYEAGFEWGEYLGLSAPWENLTPPPPRPR